LRFLDLLGFVVMLLLLAGLMYWGWRLFVNFRNRVDSASEPNTPRREPTQLEEIPEEEEVTTTTVGGPEPIPPAQAATLATERPVVAMSPHTVTALHRVLRELQR